MADVEILDPLGEIGSVIGGGDPVAAFGSDRVSGVSRKSRGQDGRTIFQRDSEYSGFAVGSQFQFVPERIAHQVARRCAGPILAGTGTDKFCGVVFDRRYALLFLWVPPFVRHDAVSIGVASGEEGGVSGSGAGVGIVVVAIGEISAAIEKHAEASVTELVAIAFEIVAAELVNHDDHNEFGAGIVSGCECSWDRNKQQQCHWQRAGKSHRDLVYRRTRDPRRDSRPRLSRRAKVASLSVVYPRCQEHGGASPRRTAEGGCPHVNRWAVGHPRARNRIFQ